MKTTIYLIAIMIAEGLLTSASAQVLYQLTRLDDGETNSVNLISVEDADLGGEIEASISIVSESSLQEPIVMEMKVPGLEWQYTSMRGKLDGMYVSLVNLTISGKPEASFDINEGEVIPLFTFSGNVKQHFKLMENDHELELIEDEGAVIEQRFNTDSGRNIYQGNVRPPYHKKRYSKAKDRQRTSAQDDDNNGIPKNIESIHNTTSMMLNNTFFQVLSVNEQMGLGGRNMTEKEERRSRMFRSIQMNIGRRILIRESAYRIGLKVDPNPYSLVKAYMKIENNPEIKNI